MTETNTPDRNYQPGKKTKIMATLAALASAAGLAGSAGAASAAEHKVGSAAKIELASGGPNLFAWQGKDKKLAKEWENRERAKAKEMTDLDKSGKVKIFPGAVQIKMTGMMHLQPKDQPQMPFYMFYNGPGSKDNVSGNDNTVRIIEKPRFAKYHGVDCMFFFLEDLAKTDPHYASTGQKEATYDSYGTAQALTIVPIPELNELVKKGLIQIQLWGSKVDTNPPLVKQKVINGHYAMDGYQYADSVGLIVNPKIGIGDSFMKINNEQLDAGQGTVDVDGGGAEGYLYDQNYILLPSSYKSPLGFDMTRNQQY